MESVCLTSNSELETKLIGSKLSQEVIKTNTGCSKVIFLQGDLGAGKTVLTKGFIEGLGYKGLVKSPTFNIVEIYDISNYSVFHFDFFRITKEVELKEIGIEEYLVNKKGISLIEWPDRITSLLPEPDINIFIEHSISDDEKTREIKLESKLVKVLKSL